MRTQLTGNFESAANHRLTAAAVAVLVALGPIATARAVSLSDRVLNAPVAGADLVRSGYEATFGADLVTSARSYEPDFGTAGLTVMGPFAAEDGESSGMVLGWTANPRDPAYLFTVDALFAQGVRSSNAGDEIFWARPNLGVVPGGNLSVFESGAVDAISWDFLEFGCALLALRVEDYLRLRDVLEPGEFDSNARIAGQLQPVPDPATSLLVGQGLLALALLGPRRIRCWRAP